MFPHSTPSHLAVDVRFAGVSPKAMLWVAGGAILGIWLTGIPALLLLAHFHADPVLIRLCLFLAGFVPCYLLARWRPLDMDPARYALVRLQHATAPELCVWRPWGGPLLAAPAAVETLEEDRGIPEW